MILHHYVHFNGKGLAVFFGTVFFYSKVFWLKMQKSTFFKEKMVLSVVILYIYKINV